MIQKYNEIFNLEEYKKVIGYDSNIHNVSFLHKELDLKNKKILILDFEFSKNNFIYEFGGIVIENKKITKTIFEEYSIPKNEQIFDFKLKRFVYNNYLNKNKPLFKKEDIEELINEIDYIVVHNYTAEAQCLFKLFNNQENKYDFQKCKFKDKIICTNYSFHNKYFKNLGMNEFSNEKVYEYFNWNIEKDGQKFILKLNEKEMFRVISPNEKVMGKLHNAFYDSLITLANLITLVKIQDKQKL